MKTIGIIPARGGSKGIPRKNMAMCGGKPLIQWTIEAARASNLTHLVVTSEDNEILSFAEANKTHIVVRSERLASDTAKMTDVVRDALAATDQEFDYALLLQPTSPLRTTEDINAAIAMYPEEVTSVYESLALLWHEESGNRQARGSRLFQNGAIYGFVPKGWDGVFAKPSAKWVVMPRSRSVDVDDEFDLEIADWLLRRRA